MVRATLEDRKTHTRRTMRPQPAPGFLKRGVVGVVPQWPMQDGVRWFMADGCSELIKCPYGKPGDRLWVREEHYRIGHWEEVPGVKTKGRRQKWKFVADSDEVRFDPPASFRKGRHHNDPGTITWHKRLARFMFRKHSRITLEITGIRVERLNDISEDDAKSEGIEGRFHPNDPQLWTWKDYGRSKVFKEEIFHYGSSVTPKSTFQSLWQSINGPKSWDENPYVWVIEFKKV